MGTFIPINPNIMFEMDSAFGNFDKEIVFNLFRFVDEGFSKVMGIIPYYSTP